VIAKGSTVNLSEAPGTMIDASSVHAVSPDMQAALAL
jgi:hypothetical protein